MKKFVTRFTTCIIKDITLKEGFITMNRAQVISLHVFKITFQILALCCFYEAGEMLVRLTHIPIPGNLVGMFLLFLCFCFKIAKIEWFQTGSTFLIAITPLFFVPSLTGLINYGPLFLHEGLLIVTVTILSGCLIFFISGWTLELLVRVKAKND